MAALRLFLLVAAFSAIGGLTVHSPFNFPVRFTHFAILEQASRGGKGDIERKCKSYSIKFTCHKSGTTYFFVRTFDEDEIYIRTKAVRTCPALTFHNHQVLRRRRLPVLRHFVRPSATGQARPPLLGLVKPGQRQTFDFRVSPPRLTVVSVDAVQPGH